MNNSCTYAALTAVLITGLITSLFMPDTTPNADLVKANQQLQDKLMEVAAKSEKAYDDAANALNEEKKRIAASCPK